MGTRPDTCAVRERREGTDFAVLTSVAVVGNDRGDATGTRTTRGANQHHQLHEVVVDVRRTGGLDNEQILATNIFVDVDHHLSVSETTKLEVRLLNRKENSAGTQLSTKILHDLLCEGTVRRTREDSQVALNTF